MSIKQFVNVCELVQNVKFVLHVQNICILACTYLLTYMVILCCADFIGISLACLCATVLLAAVNPLKGRGANWLHFAVQV